MYPMGVFKKVECLTRPNQTVLMILSGQIILCTVKLEPFNL